MRWPAAQRATSRNFSRAAASGLPLLYMAMVTRSPMPLKRSMSSPKPMGSICVRLRYSASSAPAFCANML
jgi:hypothetical protein